jgi:hypothetical protein
MGVLANGGNLLQISPFIQKTVIGAVIVIAVTFDELQRRRQESRQRISKELYIGSLVIFGGTGLFLLGYSHAFSITPKTGVLMIILALCSTIVMMTLFYKMWKAIQDGHARATPGKAIGLLFIPIFSFYWIFQVTRGFAKDYNQYIDRHSLGAKKLSEGLFMAFALLSLASPIPLLGTISAIADFFVSVVLVSKICDAVNAIPEGRQAGALPEAPGDFSYGAERR